MKRSAVFLIGLALFLAGQTTTPVAAATATPAAPAISIATCTWRTVENPHISTVNAERTGALDIKTSTQGDCSGTTDPLVVTAQMTLEREVALGFYTTVATGAPISKDLQAGPQVWRRGELFALLSPCVPGTYRGRLNVTAAGAVVIGFDPLSAPQKIDCKPKRVSMVIDDTGSMSGIISSVSSTLADYISSRPEDEYTRWSLTTFKDSPTTVGTTEDRAQALAWVNSLSASGGGDCPEDALGGISNGLAQLGTEPTTDKEMLVATDASAQGGDVDGIIAAAQAAGVHVNVLLAGDCGLAAASARTVSASTPAAFVPGPLSSQVVLKRIADETGGLYFFIPGGTAADFKAALADIFANIADPTPTDSQPPTVNVSVTPNRIWPPNHKMVEIKATVTATDDLDTAPRVELVGVEVSEPADGQGDGHTATDVQITSDGRILVRAERSAKLGTRVYTITYRATDAAGNIGYGSATVTVPRSQGTA